MDMIDEWVVGIEHTHIHTHTHTRSPTSHSWDHGEMPLGMVHDEWVVGIERRESSTPSGGFVQLLLRPVSRMPADGTDATVDALTLALETLEEELSRLGLDLSRHCMFVHLYLGNMGHFAAANKAYSHAFPLSNPPSRSCVQATSYRGLIYMAGSMPLDPSSMLVAAPGDVGAQARKALANAEAVAIALGASMLRGCLSLTVFVAAEAAETGGVLEALAAIEAELDGAVAAAAAAGNIGSAGFSSDDEDAGEDAGEGARLTLRVDPYLAEPSIAAPLRPTVVVVVVPALPRGCLVEVEPLLVDVAHFDALAAMPCASSSESGSEGGKEGDSGDGQEGEEGKEGEDGMEGEEAGGSSSTPETAAAAAPASPMAQASEAPAPAADAPPSPAPSPSPLAQQHQPAAAAADLSVSVPASPAVAPPAATPSPRLPPLSPREPSGSPAPLARSGHGGTHAHGASSRLGARVSGGGGVDDVIGPLGSGLLGGAVAAAAAAAASGGAGSSKGHRRRGSVTSSAFMTLEGFGRGAGAGGGGGREKEREREDIVATVRGGLSEALINAALSSAALSSLASAGSGGDVGVLEAVLTGAFSGFDGSVASGSPAALPGSRALSLSQPLPAVVDGTVPGESLVTTVVHQGVLLLSLLHLPVGVFQGPGDLHARLHRATAAVLSQHGMSLSNVVRAIAFVDVSKVPNLTGPPAPDGGAGEAGSGCQSGGGGEQGQEDEAQPHFHVTWVPVLSVSSSACSNCAAIVEVLAQL
ncbi:hypothetical protein FOA52_006784 [Chlamydomonas sp. UWO 241]|nr:hypothetical protein FOA52_006784 [Chlamydomonas sp. UWO 241]